MLLPGERGGRIEMHRHPAPLMRDNAGNTGAGAALIMDPRKQDPQLGRYAGPRLFLQAALAQHPLEKGSVADKPRPARTCREPVRELALEHRFPTWEESVIQPHIGGKESTLRPFAKILDRAKLDFHLAGGGHSRIRAVEWSIGLRRGAPACKSGRRRKCGDTSHRFHGAGRNTQIAAGSFGCARTAT